MIGRSSLNVFVVLITQTSTGNAPTVHYQGQGFREKKKETTNEPQEIWTMLRQARSTLTHKHTVDNYDDDGSFGYETDVS